MAAPANLIARRSASGHLETFLASSRMSVVGGWSQLIDATLYLERQDGVLLCVRGNVAASHRPRRRSCGIGAESNISRNEIDDALGKQNAGVKRFKARAAFASFNVVLNKDAKMWV